MVFIYHFLSSPENRRLTSKVASFFKDIEKGRYIGMISTFTIAEYIAVTKVILCNKRDRQVSDNEIRMIKERIEKFIMRMGITLHDADSLASRMAIFSECENLVESATAFKGRDTKWHSIKGADALHVALALSMNAEALATFDDDFRGISGLINPIMLSEAY